jgi:predicted transcriptional regulator
MKKAEQEVIDILISKLGIENKTTLKKNKAYFDMIRNVMRALNNERRSKIVHLLKESPKTITELSKQFNIDYKAVWKHVMILEKAGIVRLEKDEQQKGRPVKVYHVNFYKSHKEKEQQENSNK